MSGSSAPASPGSSPSTGSRLPARLDWSDVVRLGLATHKLSRLVTKDDVTTFVRAPATRDAEASEPAQGGLRRALGELVTCPYCIGLWIAADFTGALVVRPRETSFVATILAVHAVSDTLHAGFTRMRP